MWKKDMQRLIDEQTARIGKLTADIQSMEGQLGDYRMREKSIVSTLAVAHDKAETMLAEAEHNAAARTAEATAAADALLASARADADALTADADARAAQTLEDARRAADETLAAANAEAEQTVADAKARAKHMLAEAEAAAAEYEAVLKNYNAAVTAAAAVAAENAARFASFIGEQTLESPGLSTEIVGRAEAVTADPQPGELPDPADSPAQLMRNIYALQYRVPPDKAEQAETAQAAAEAFETVPAEHPAEDAAEPEADMPAPAAEAPEASEAEDAAQAFSEEPAKDAAQAFTEAPAEEDAQASEEDAPVPTVNQYVKDDPDAADGDLSLDALLDEIIKAGEKHNG